MANSNDRIGAESVSPDFLYTAAQDHFVNGRYAEAIRCLVPLRLIQAYRLKANTNISSCLLLLNKHKQALVFADHALEQDPSHLPAISNRIAALKHENRHEEIVNFCESIITSCPKEDSIWNLLATSFRAIYGDSATLAIAESWLQACPKSHECLLLTGELQSNLGNDRLAISTLGKALELDCTLERVYSHLSVVMMRLKHFDAALQYVNKAIEINPSFIIYSCRKAMALWLSGSWQEAANQYKVVAAVRPESVIYLLNSKLILPHIPKDTGEICEAREKFIDGLAVVERSKLLALDLSDEAIPHTFELAYHNQEDRCILERYMSLMRKLSVPFVNEVKSSFANYQKAQEHSGAKTDRIRIGFISQSFYNHSNSIAFSGLIRNLDKHRFEIVIIHAVNSRKDCIRDSLDTVCDQVVCLSHDYIESGLELFKLELDILFFTDLGMNAYEFLFPFLRAAKIQLTGWGIPHTSGIKEIDYYISAQGVEPPESESFYTEMLVKLPVELPCCFETEGVETPALAREYFFLPPGEILIGCLQGLHKIHPDYDTLLERIATENPEVGFVFIEDSISSLTQLFLDRLSRSAPSVRNRCFLLAMMGRSEYRALCHSLDLLLDPIYYGCGITFFEASLVGTPVVTMQGHNLRSRIVETGYRAMGLVDIPLAATPDEYVSITTALCNDHNRRRAMKKSILASNHKIFDQIQYVREFEDFCAGQLARRK